MIVNDEKQTLDLLDFTDGAMAVAGLANLEPVSYNQIRLLLRDVNEIEFGFGDSSDDTPGWDEIETPSRSDK